MSSMKTSQSDSVVKGHLSIPTSEQPPPPAPTSDKGSRKNSHAKRPSFGRLASMIGGRGDLSLFEDDTTAMPSLGDYLRSLTGLAAEDTAPSSGHGGKAKLGTLFGVYLPSIQHILGVQMFLRLLWITGIAGLTHSIVMVFICCLCTFLTSISISAIATNGKIESGGAYFMISRNLGPEFGGAIGILFYLANTVATAMYLVGGVEVLLVYIAPGLPQFGTGGHEADESAMFNNFRIYGTFFLIIVFLVCAVGVKFVQFFAPISLAAVLLSILATVVGSIVARPTNSPMICMLGDRLLLPDVYKDQNGTVDCHKEMNGTMWNHFCVMNETDYDCDPYFEAHEPRYIPGIPGFSSGVISRNAWPVYLSQGESSPGDEGDKHAEVVQDISTDWFVLLAIFFPSVTGIMTGANMSGDLKDPQKSLPVGTIAAQMTTSVIYLILVICYAGTIEGALLRDKYGESVHGSMIVASLAWPNEWVLLIGSFLACIGAGLQCLCSAPRLLQSIAKDNIIPVLSVFSTLTKRNEPFRALILSTLIAECGVLIGGIDYIAPVVDFFFLMSYCFVNIVCTLQTLLKAPNWRPRFKYFHWTLSLLGALLCLFIMFATYWYYAVVVIILCTGLYKYIEYKGAKQEWGDGIRGLALSTAQYSLMKTEGTDKHPKNWRPQLLVLLKLKEEDGEDMESQKLLNLAGSLKAGRGLTMVATLLEGDLSAKDDRDQADLAKVKIRRMMKQAKVKGFVEAVVVPDIVENVGSVIQCVGMGGLRPNTIVVGWPRGWKENSNKNFVPALRFLHAIQRAASADMCLLVPKGLRMYPEIGDQLTGTIDVWWIIHDGGLLILLPFLLRQHRVWRGCKMRVFAVAQSEDNTVKMKEELRNWVYNLRIDCTVEVVELADSTVSAYAYDRTLMMEERARLASNLRMSVRKRSLEPQMLADMARLGQTPFTGLGQRKPSVVATLAAAALPKKLFGLSEETDVESARKSSINSKKSADFGSRTKSESPEAPLRGIVNPIFDENEELEADDDAKDKQTEKKQNKEQAKEKAPEKPQRVKEPQPFSFNEPEKSPDDNMKDFMASLAEKVNASAAQQTKPYEGEKPFDVDKNKISKMNTAVKLNRAIKEQSKHSRLVIMNLPRPPTMREAFSNYMEYLEVMTEGLERVLLVRGSGKEVVTIYS